MPDALPLYRIKTHWFWVGICFFLSIHSASSQNKSRLTGKITPDSIDFQVNIINVTGHSGTISKKDGSFEMPVNNGDELIFTAMGYENYELMVTDSLLENSPIEIKLEKAVNRLREVKIFTNNLTGDLMKDAAQIEYFDQSKVGIPFSKGKKFTQAERRAFTASSTNIDYLLNVISGRMKMLKRMMENEKVENKKDKLNRMFEEDFFVKELEIPKELIENFLYYCLDFTEVNSSLKEPLEATEFLKLQAKAYRISMKLD